MKPMPFFGFFLAGVLVFSACQKNAQPPQGPPEKITIAYSQSPYGISLAVALVNGFFSAEGLEVIAQPHEFGKMALNSMLEGKADLAITGDTPVMFAILGGQKIALPALIATSRQNQAIVARKDRGIVSPKDLKGKRIGVTFGTSAHFFLESFLSRHQIDRNKVPILYTTPKELKEALTAGRIDAVAIWNPFLKQLEKSLGKNSLVFYDESLYTDSVLVVAFQEFTRKHPETIKKVLRALIRAETFIKEKPDESRRLAAGFLKFDTAVADETWEVMDYEAVLDQSFLVRLEEQTRWAQRNNLTLSKATPNYLQFIYFDALQSLKPEAVRIIR